MPFGKPVLVITFAHDGCSTDMRLEQSPEFTAHLKDHPVCAWEVVRCLLVVMQVLAENPTSPNLPKNCHGVQDSSRMNVEHNG